MFVIARLARPFVALASAAVVLSVFAALPAQAAEAGTFVGRKVCSGPLVAISPPNPGGYCLITQASLKILLGAHDYYTNPTVTRTSIGALAVVSSPVTIRAADKMHSTAQGHCTYYYLPPAHGLCVFWSGTGKLDGFHARFVIGSPVPPTGVSVVGPYWFDRDEDRSDD
jgi:hypothetical protein